MKLEEMTPQQHADWTTIVGAFSAAGWEMDQQTRDVMNGGDRYWAAVFRHFNGQIELTALFKPEDSRINIIFRQPDGTDIHLAVEYQQSLTSLLAVLTSSQDSIDTSNARSVIADIVRTCPETFVAVSDDELTRVTLDGLDDVL